MRIISKDEYLNFRQEWKQSYAHLAREIRALKNAEKLASKAGYAAFNRLVVQQKVVDDAKDTLRNLLTNASVVQSMRAKRSNYAHSMMDELDEMKEASRISVHFLRYMEQRNYTGE
jgi:hypothetical protein